MFPPMPPASPLIGADPAVTPIAPPLPEPAVAWSTAADQAVKDLAALTASLTDALENAEECDYCDPGTEKLIKDSLAKAMAMTADLTKIADDAKVAVEDEADASDASADDMD